tara:strand:- start:21634 stop:22950 length:1317 start_codon:yes stop_codon:yes gene_type:complete
MKILFINPATKRDRKSMQGKAKGSNIFRYSKLGILSVAALTPKDIEIEFTDEIIENINFNTDADLIAISAVTALAPRSYEIATEFKKRGKTIVMGGMHATFLSDECLNYVDSVVIGQAEGSWQRLIQDFKDGKIQKKYISKQNIILKLPKACRIPEGRKGYAKGHVFGITRGCIHKCDFCSVRCFFDSKYYKRPIEEVITELKELPWKIINIVDDNIFCDPKYAKRLFKALIPLKKHILFQASIEITHDLELMSLIKKAGGKGVFIGIESLNKKNMKDIKKFQNITNEYKKVIKIFHQYGIVVEAGLMFGFDYDNQFVFKEMYDFVNKTNVDLIQVGIVTPMPGTPLFDKLKKEKRINDYNWEHYDCRHMVFKLKLMNKKDLEDGANWLRKKFYSYPSIIKRGICNFSYLGVIGTFAYFLRGNLGFRKNYKLGLDYPP